MKKLKKLLQHEVFHKVLFYICLVLLVWPFLGTAIVTSLMNLFTYFFFVWACIILILFTIANSRKLTDSEENNKIENH